MKKKEAKCSAELQQHKNKDKNKIQCKHKCMECCVTGSTLVGILM